TYVVVKNTLLRIAAQDAGIEGLDSYLEQNTAIAVAPEDPVAVAKIICDFAKANKVMKVKVGILDGKLISAEEIKALAELPPREVLLAKMLGSMQAPISGLANVLQGTIRKFVYALEAVRKAKESA
ncbi:MAG: 50S ribosomal protein L10, partial [Acidaminococcaceae bacterium]